MFLGTSRLNHVWDISTDSGVPTLALSHTAQTCFQGATQTPAANTLQCPPRANPLFKACSTQQQPCQAPACGM